MSLILTSPAFTHGSTIPPKYTCEGENISPPLQWDDIPQETASFALVMYDPDAPSGIFTHWVIFNIPPEARELSEGMPGDKVLENSALQGKNSAGEIGYFGPCPPPGKPHHYHFVLYAIDDTLALSPGVSREEVIDAIEGHVLEEAILTGLYGR